MRTHPKVLMSSVWRVLLLDSLRASLTIFVQSRSYKFACSGGSGFTFGGGGGGRGGRHGRRRSFLLAYYHGDCGSFFAFCGPSANGVSTLCGEENYSEVL